MERVVITGLGVVSPLGIGTKMFCEALHSASATYRDVAEANREAAASTEFFDFAACSRFAGDKRTKYMDRYTQYVAVAIEEALADAGLLDNQNVNLSEAGIILGSAQGCVETNSKYFEGLYHKGPRLVNPVIYQNTVPNTACGYCAMLFGMGGVNTMISSGSTSSLNAIAYGYTSVKMGRSNIILVGGVERRCERLSQGSSSDEDGDTAQPHEEGSAVMVIESMAHALERKAEIYAEIKGYGIASHSSLQESLALATKEATTEAAISMQDISTVIHASHTAEANTKWAVGATFQTVETLLKRSRQQRSAQECQNFSAKKRPHTLISSQDKTGSTITLCIEPY